ncbi:MAG TPA: hypothetical protein VKZ79_01670 [Alphaproteobacteria bacterium]|nr:hypothetical protein [Alphaproteobacteria bacterium]
MDAASKSALVPNQALAPQFLAWVDARPRSYRETIGAWRTSCPRLTIWEDCRDAGLAHLARCGG